MLFGNKTNATLLIGNMLKDCRDSEAVYSALKMENLINIEDQINIRDVSLLYYSADSFVLERVKF